VVYAPALTVEDLLAQLAEQVAQQHPTHGACIRTELERLRQTKEERVQGGGAKR
jgi:hypothetical protein